MSYRWLHMHLSAPLMSFGGVAIDHVGQTRDFPAVSALTGLLANAMGWRWQDRSAHQELQARLVFGAGIARQGRVVTDTQNVKLEKSDKGWTTRGAPEGRAGATYDSPHRRQRDYLADHACRVVLRLNDGDGSDLDALAEALQRPARPLFLGRKPCLPTEPIFAGWASGVTARAALCSLDIDWSQGGEALWPETDDLPEGARIVDLTDLRNWDSGLHGGARPVVRGRLA